MAILLNVTVCYQFLNLNERFTSDGSYSGNGFQLVATIERGRKHSSNDFRYRTVCMSFGVWIIHRLGLSEKDELLLIDQSAMNWFLIIVPCVDCVPMQAISTVRIAAADRCSSNITADVT